MHVFHSPFPALRNDLTSIKGHEHGCIGFQLLDRDGEAKVIEEQELQFQVVELRQR